MLKLILSCVCCGSAEFKNEISTKAVNVEGSDYIYHEDLLNVMVECSKCGLKDYVGNLVVKYDLND